jgi:beta-hydroxylase
LDFDTTILINNLLSSFCTDPPILNSLDFEWSQELRDNWKTIRDEFNLYSSYIPTHRQLNNTVGSCDTQGKWKTLYLRAYNKDTNIINFFPTTKKLIDKIPCTLAFFSIIEPYSKLEPHIGIYKGVIRYHLSLIVPDTPEQCFIDILGQKLYWKEGSDIMFDDTFLHYVENNTNQRRVVLFLDIQRDFKNVFINMLNSILLYFITSNDILNSIVDNANYYTIQ